VLMFTCTDCRQTISGEHRESEEVILERLGAHVAKCPLAQFTYGGLTERAAQRVEALRLREHELGIKILWQS
jgi:hypothetical protein